jgi:cytochrome d ubiquinol oxidase subunit II
VETWWFSVLAGMLAAYVVLDGFDLGAGILHLYAARTDAERRLVLQSIGPVWDGNEVWLIAAGGTLYFAFPALYAASFSGFYLPLMIVLWLLVLRGVAIEWRHHIPNRLWQPFWDVVFSGASTLLALCFGVALGNVVRGVPLDAEMRFFLPLWTDFRPGPQPGIFDWYTALVGVGAASALALHGARWLVLKTSGPVADRARRAARSLWWGVLVWTVGVTLATFQQQPHVPARLVARPWGFVFPAIAIAGLGGIAVFDRRRAERAAFLASCAYLAGLMASVAFGLYPFVLPSNAPAGGGLDIYRAAAGPHGLRVGLAWFLPGLAFAVASFVFAYRRLAGKVTLDPSGY